METRKIWKNLVYIQRMMVDDMKYQKIVSQWQRKNIQGSADFRFILKDFDIDFAYHSSKIENPKITYELTKNIFEKDSVSNYTGDLCTLCEIRNAKDAINMMLDAIDRQQPIDETFVRHIQYELTKGTYNAWHLHKGERSGTYKQHDYIVGREEVGASAEDTPMEMQELFEDISGTLITSANVVKVVAYIHCKMENIHPFMDGNGRTGRLLANYLLMLYNHPPIIVFFEDKKQYFEALHAWDERQSIAEMEAFIKAETVKTWADQWRG